MALQFELTVNDDSKNHGLGNPVSSTWKKQHGRVPRLSKFIQSALNRDRIVPYAIAGHSIGRLNIRPTREGSNKLVALSRNGDAGVGLSTRPGRCLGEGHGG